MGQDEETAATDSNFSSLSLPNRLYSILLRVDSLDELGTSFSHHENRQHGVGCG